MARGRPSFSIVCSHDASLGSGETVRYSFLMSLGPTADAAQAGFEDSLLDCVVCDYDDDGFLAEDCGGTDCDDRDSSLGEDCGGGDGGATDGGATDGGATDGRWMRTRE